jgi:hypothetical protein
MNASGSSTLALRDSFGSLAHQSMRFFPPSSGRSDSRNGFRRMEGGTHSSRTMMFAELSTVLGIVPAAFARSAYTDSIVHGNALHKATAATRRISTQRLAELYALDPAVPVFRVLRNLWSIDSRAQPLLALLVALARDPLLRASAAPVLVQSIGAEVQRAPIRDALSKVVGSRMNDATIDKVVRNVMSSWTQSGHLAGRTFKFRQHVDASPTALAMALWIANAAGLGTHELLTSGWVAALDCTASSARGLALEAKRIGLIDLQIVGEVVEFGLERLDPAPRKG